MEGVGREVNMIKSLLIRGFHKKVVIIELARPSAPLPSSNFMQSSNKINSRRVSSSDHIHNEIVELQNLIINIIKGSNMSE